MTGFSCPHRGQLVEFLHGQLDETSAEQLGVHLDECRECEQRLQELEEVERVLPAGISTSDASNAGDDAFTSSMREAIERLLKRQPPLQKPARIATQDACSQLGHFRIVEELGRGGMGTVYLARDTRLDREVALKVPQGSLTEDPEAMERLLREARAAASLRHANICPIYETGESNGQPFIAMAYIQGKTLSKWAAEGRSMREIAEMMSTLCEAVAFAHAKGIVHRDLKPSNVMIEAESNAPILMDFGLAVDVGQQEARTTQDGRVIGTPAYMAPEQAAGRIYEVGPGADVYALGAILYELLCGRVPFRGPLAEVLTKVQHEEPPSLRQLSPRVHRDLETIVLQSMAKEVSMRYAAAELAEDLQRFSQGEPILARRIGPLRRLAYRVRRRPLIPLLSALAVVVVAMAAFYVPHLNKTRRASRLVSEVHDLLDRKPWSPGDVAAVETRIAALEQLSATAAQTSHARLAARISQSVRERLREPRLAPQDVNKIDELLDLLSPHSAKEASDLRTKRDARLRQWQLDFEMIPPFSKQPQGFSENWIHAASADALALQSNTSAASGSVAVLSDWSSEGNTRMDAVFDGSWQSGEQLGLLMHCDGGSADPITCLACSPNGRHLAAGNAAGNIAIWQVETGREVALVRAHENAVMTAIYSNTGNWLATCTGAGEVAIWNALDWSQHARFISAQQTQATTFTLPPFNPLAFSRDDRFLAVGQSLGESRCDVIVWNVAENKESARLSGHTDSITSLSFHPTDVQQLASASMDGTVRRWNPPQPEAIATFQASPKDRHNRIWNSLVSVAFSEDGNELLAGERQEKLLQWNLLTGELAKEWATSRIGNGRDGLNDVILSPGRSLLALRHRPQLDIWSYPEMNHLWTVAEGAACFAPQEKWLAVGTAMGTIQLWDISRRRLDATLGGRSLAFLVRPVDESQALNSTDSLPLTRDGSPRKLGGQVEMSILRNGVLLRSRELLLQQGPLHLSVQCQDGVLTFQANGQPPMVFRDILPANRPTSGAYGVVWSAEAQLKRLSAYRQPLPPVSSPLELGDQHYASGRYEEAYAEYNRQALLSGSEVTGAAVCREADCKSAFCLSALGRYEQAEALLKTLLKEETDRDPWTAAAFYQLWLLAVLQSRFEDASDVSEAMLLRYDSEHLAEYGSEETRRHITDACAPLFDANFGVLRFNSVRQLQTLYDARQLLSLSPALQEHLAFQLVGGMRGSHLDHRAQQIAAMLHADYQRQPLAFTLSELPDVSRLRAHHALAHYLGEHARPLQRIDQIIFGTAQEQLNWQLDQQPLQTTNYLATDEPIRPALLPQGCVLFLERARALAQAGRWQEALDSLREFHHYSTMIPLRYNQHALSHLLEGIAHQQQGEYAKAQDAWRQARWAEWKSSSASSPLLARTASAEQVLLNYLATSLDETASKESKRQTLEQLFQIVGASDLLKVMDHDGPLQAQQHRSPWLTPSGQQVARHIVQGELLPAEQLRAGIQFIVASNVAQGCPATVESSGHEQIVQDMVKTLFELVRTGRIQRTQLQLLLIAWRGDLDEVGWAAHKASALSLEQQSQIAYLLGTRLLHIFNRQEDAAKMFLRATETSSDSSMTHRLAKAELHRLGPQPATRKDDSRR